MPITFELTRDQSLLQQYYQLREAAFREEIGITDFDGSEELADRLGRILVAHQDGKCIGGARISRRSVERGEYRELELASMACCTWERLVLDPEIRTVQLSRDFCSHLIDVSRVLGFQHALLVSSLRNARYYRKCHSALGVDFRIHRPAPEYAQGTFAELEHYLSVSHLGDSPAWQMAA